MVSPPAAPQLSSTALLGKVVFTRYLLENKLGQGGMAWVFQAWDLDDDQPVAIKILLPHIAEDAELAKRFLREATIQGKLQHPHIVKLLTTCHDSGLSSIVMEWVEGESFYDLLQRLQKPLEGYDLLHLMLPILDAVEYAHQNQMVHRDLKLENLLIHWQDGRPFPKVADFGLAKILDDMEENQTKTDVIMGTLRYMPPEQVNSMKDAGPAADIYSLGICLYILATGQAPFTGTAQELVVSILTKEPPDPRSFHRKLPAELAQVILKSIAKEPEQRYASCSEFAHALKAVLDPKAAYDSSSPLMVALQRSADDHEIALGDTLDASLSSLIPPPPEAITIAHRPENIARISRLFSGEQLDRSPPTSSRKLWWGFAFFVLLLGGAALYHFYHFLPTPPSPDPIRTVPAATCVTGSVRPCYTGPKGTEKRGICKMGLQTCKENRYGPCEGQILPAPQELCNNKDDNCDGKVDESFPKKGDTCVTHLGTCAWPGTWACNKQGSGMVCQQNTPNVQKPPTHQVTLRLLPANTAIQLRYLEHKEQATAMSCVAVKQRRVRVTLHADGFYRCRITLTPRSPATLTLTLKPKKRYGLEPEAGYCKP